MQIHDLKDFKRGWFIGNFLPTIYRCNQEVGIQKYVAGEQHAAHYHARGTEINVVISGECSFKLTDIIEDIHDYVEIHEGQCIKISPYVVTQFDALTDCQLLVIKTVSDINDKFIVDEFITLRQRIIPATPFPIAEDDGTKRFELSGKSVGDWTVTSQKKVLRTNGKGYARFKEYWLCRCKCGTLKWIYGYTLEKGKAKACVSCNSKLGEFGGIRRRLFRQYRASAVKRGYDFSIDYSEFCSMLDKDCRYCGLPPSNSGPKEYGGLYLYQGIDRKDNTLGYTAENCVPCCETCNRAKLCMSETAFFGWVERVYRKTNNASDSPSR